MGCCSLRVEHMQFPEDKPFTIVLDFLGKDSMRYFNEIKLDERVYECLKDFCQDKKPTADVFDKVNPGDLNKHLQSLMPGLTAKVFRTYNASVTLEQELYTNPCDPDLGDAQKLLFYNRYGTKSYCCASLCLCVKCVAHVDMVCRSANREVAVLCNHQRTVPKGHEAQMQKLDETLEKAQEERDAMVDTLAELKNKNKAKKKQKYSDDIEEKRAKWTDADKLSKALEKLEMRIENMTAKKTMKSETRTVALGTSKINYMDPRITVAWCKASEVGLALM